MLSTKFNQSQTSLSSLQQSSTGSNNTATSTSVTSTTASSNQSLNGVTVLVANGTSTLKAASYFSNILKTEGANTLTPTDAIPAGTTAVYYIQGQQQAAAAVAADLKLSASAISPMPAGSPPVTSLGSAQILVVVGPNLLSQITTTTT